MAYSWMCGCQVDGEWVTSGMWQLMPGETTYIADTLNRYNYFHVRTESGLTFTENKFAFEFQGQLLPFIEVGFPNSRFHLHSARLLSVHFQDNFCRKRHFSKSCSWVHSPSLLGFFGCLLTCLNYPCFGPWKIFTRSVHICVCDGNVMYSSSALNVVDVFWKWLCTLLTGKSWRQQDILHPQLHLLVCQGISGR